MATTVTVGGEITWDVVISVGFSIVSALIAFFSVKNKVEQLAVTLNSLEDGLEEDNRYTKSVEKDIKYNLDLKIEKVTGSIEEVNNKIYEINENIKQIIDSDIAKLETKYKIDINNFNNLLDKNIVKYDRRLIELEAKILDTCDKDIEKLQTHNLELIQNINNSIGDNKNNIAILNKKISRIEIDLAALGSNLNNVVNSINNLDDKNKLSLEHIKIILGYIENDMINIKRAMQTIKLKKE